MSLFNNKNILVTGGTGSFGKKFVRTVLDHHSPNKIVVFSRDELKQYEMGQAFDDPRIRYFIGDVRDKERLKRAFSGIDYVVHAAALKQVPAAEYNPFEAVKTNIHGAQNVIDAAIDSEVEKVIALSTDKASSPINLYGATKLVSDKIFVAGNAYAGGTKTKFAVVRYGNVVGSRGSVVPFFQKLLEEGADKLPITDDRMTRFWITLEQGVEFVIKNFAEMVGGEIFVPKIPSMKVVDLASAMAPDLNYEVIGIRPGEKLHEEMISADDARRTLDRGDCYVIQPDFEFWEDKNVRGSSLPEGFRYSSDINSDWLDSEQLKEMISG